MILGLAMWAGLVHAADTVHFEYPSYPSSGSLVGVDGWRGGYSSDDWTTDGDAV